MFRLLLCIWMVIVPFLSYANNTSVGIIPRSVLLAQADKCAVRMSPIGDKISYISRKGSSIELCITDINGQVLKKFPLKVARDMYHYFWSRDGKYILIPQDINGDENDHIICIGVKDNSVRDLTPYKGARSIVGIASKRFPDHIIILCNKRNARWFDVYKLQISSGKTELVFENNEFMDFTFDNELNLRIASKVRTDGSSAIYWIQNGKRADLWKIVPFEDTYTSEILHFSSDNNILYTISSENRDIGALYAYDVKTKTEKLLFEHDTASIDNLSCDPITYEPQLASVEYLKSEWHTIDGKMTKDITFLTSQSRGDLHILTRNISDTIWLIGYTYPNKSAQYYVYNRKGGKLKYLFAAHPELDKHPLQSKESTVITSRDGLKLVCYLTKAANFKPNGKLVVLVHGGPWARDGFGLDPTVQLLANRGYSVLQVNYRGSIGFGKKFTNAINGNISKVGNDIMDAINWAIDNKIADRNKVAIMGGSFGGYQTLAGLTFTPDTFCCGVDVVGPSNWITLFKSVPAYWQPGMVAWFKTAGDPNTEEGRQQLWAISPLSKAANIKKPLIVFQGKNDPRVNIKESEQIVAALKAKKIPVEYVLYPDEGHGFLREPNRKSYLAITEKFLSKFLGGWYEPISPNEFKESSHQILEGGDL